jgi:hypothetical protein
MKYRKLRIAFSAVCGVLFLLLIALWVRSYWRYDFVYVNNPEPWDIELTSIDGVFGASNYVSIQRWDWLSLDAPELIPPGSDEFSDQLRVWNFSWYEMGGAQFVTVPYWFVVVSTIAVGSLPWLCLRFSLRTLLIATMVIAVVLGLAIYAARN